MSFNKIDYVEVTYRLWKIKDHYRVSSTDYERSVMNPMNCERQEMAVKSVKTGIT